MMTEARAGAASSTVDPQPGVDLMGFLRRWRPSTGNGQPLEVNVLVTDIDGARTAIVALDAPSVVGAYAARVRAVVGDAVGCPAESVLVNASHTHSAPPLPGHIKTGGSTALMRPEESAYAELLLDRCARTAARAVRRLRPCRIGYGTDTFDGGVNRRQRTDDGDTVMGWNPDGPHDPEVAVIRIDSQEETPIATVVVHACHPTVVGPHVLNSSSDFVGPMRGIVRDTIGGECLFLQGTAGNIFPLEAVFDTEGPEVTFGRRLGRAALRAWDRADPVERVPRPTADRSSVDYVMWRLLPAARQPAAVHAVIERPVGLPLQQPLPTTDEMRRTAADLRGERDRLQRAGEPRDRWNAVWLHSAWADRMAQRLADGAATPHVATTVSARLVGPVLLIGLPGEPFCEIGMAIKGYFADVPTVVIGYTNDMVGYIPTEAEYALGGYEPRAHPHFDQPAPFDPSVAKVLTDAAVEAGRGALAAATR